MPRSLLSQQWVNQFTVKHVFQNTCLSGQKVPRQAILTRNKLGHGEEIMGKQKRMMSITVCSTGLTTRPKKKLFRKDSLSRRLLQQQKKRPAQCKLCATRIAGEVFNED